MNYINVAVGLHCAHAYASASEALLGIPRDKPDVVLMDIDLPGMNGIECVQKLKAVLPSINILMLTVFEDSEKIFKALASGANGYLLKRSPPAKLLEAILEVFEGGSPMSAPIARKVVRSFHGVSPVKEPVGLLSPREKEVLDLLAKGYSYEQVSEQMHISIETIRTYIRRIYEKLHVHSRTEAVAKYIRS